MPILQRDMYLGRGLGMWAFWLHRLSGLVIALYLLVHISVVALVISSKASFDSAMVFLKNPIFIALEMGLLATILVHGLNGVRLVLFDLGYGIKKQKEIFIGLMIFGLLPLAAAVVVAWPHIFG
jgi:succinate dehydrogenase / fumarate reductase, cytochrome b subunit